MKRIILLLGLFFVFYQNAKTQSIDSLNAIADSIKQTYGESSEEYITALEDIAWYYNDNDLIQESVDYFLLIRDIVRKCDGDTRKKYSSYTFQAALWGMGLLDDELTISLFQEAADLFKENGDTLDLMYSQCYYFPGLLYNINLEYEKSISILKQYLKLPLLYKERSYQLNTFNAKYFIADSYNKLGDEDNAARYYEDMFSTVVDSLTWDDVYNSAHDALFFLGWYYAENGDTLSSIGYYKSALSIISDYAGNKDNSYKIACFKLSGLFNQMNDYQSEMHYDSLLVNYYLDTSGPLSEEYSYMVQHMFYTSIDKGNYEYSFRLLEDLIHTFEEYHESEHTLLSDTLYKENLSILYLSYIADNRYNQAYSSLGKYINVISEQHGKKSAEYCSAIISMINCCYNTTNTTEELRLINDNEKLIEQYAALDDLLSFYGYCSDLYKELDQDVQSKAYFDKYSELSQQLYGNHPLDYLIYIINDIDHYTTNGQIEKAMLSISRGERFVNEIGVEQFDSITMSSWYNAQSRALCESDLVSAEDKIQIALSYLGTDSTSPSYYTAMVNKGLLLVRTNRHSEAVHLYSHLKQHLENEQTKNTSIIYQTIINNLAVSKLNLGDYGGTIKEFEDLLSLTAQTYGKSNRVYLNALLNVLNYYNLLEEYDKVINTVNEITMIARSMYGDSCNDIIALAALNLGYALIGKKQYVSAIEAFKSIIPENADDSMRSIHIYKALLGLGTVYGKIGEAQSCHDSFSSAKSELLKHFDSTSTEYLDYLVSYADAIKDINYPKSLEMLNNAIDICNEQSYQLLPLYHSALISRSTLNIQHDKYSESDILPIYNSYRNLYEKNISLFANAERESYLKNNNLDDVIFSLRQTSKNDSILMDYVLLNKNLLLRTNSSFVESITTSNNPELTDKLDEMRLINADIQRESTSHHPDINKVGELSARSLALERVLIAQSREYDDYTRKNSISWKSIQSKLSGNSIAVEYIDYTDVKTGIRKYAALLLKGDWNTPKYISLCSEEDLLMSLSQETDSLYSNTFQSNHATELLWRPISSYVKKGDIIYYSPTGSLHTTALENLYYDEKTLGEQYQMYRCSSTSIIIQENNRVPYTSAVVYGGLTYSISADDMLAQSYAYSQSRNAFIPHFTKESRQDRAGLSFLYGSKVETDDISKMMSDAGYKVCLYQAKEGNEESFKALSDSSFNILHLATHGYFINADTLEKTPLPNSFLLDVLRSGMMNSFSRQMSTSGLLLSGANAAWTGNEVQDVLEDGILTSAEISYVNLANTDLVVLSACETGLGNVTPTGVYGLQRAFKNAGVNSLLMTLWKVDDVATSVMMKEFYKNLLSGKSKTESFNLAIRAVKSEFSEPKYWAGFIMLDGIH